VKAENQSGNAKKKKAKSDTRSQMEGGKLRGVGNENETERK